jgi:hypothetical protein
MTSDTINLTPVWLCLALLFFSLKFALVVTWLFNGIILFGNPPSLATPLEIEGLPNRSRNICQISLMTADGGRGGTGRKMSQSFVARKIQQNKYSEKSSRTDIHLRQLLKIFWGFAW